MAEASRITMELTFETKRKMKRETREIRIQA
jgi:hypothetical protein